jgi:hypothetical protein
MNRALAPDEKDLIDLERAGHQIVGLEALG